jgi:hypothetical protein
MGVCWWLLVFGCWLFVCCFLSVVVCCWLLVFGLLFVVCWLIKDKNKNK